MKSRFKGYGMVTWKKSTRPRRPSSSSQSPVWAQATPEAMMQAPG